MDIIFRVCGIAICAVAASFVLKDSQKNLAVVLSVLCFIIIVTYTVSSSLKPLMGQAEAFYGGGEFASFALILLKAMSISFVAGITVKICESCGESGLSFAVGLAAGCEILLLSLPLVESLLGIAREVLM